jgi:hypothetical protein
MFFEYALHVEARSGYEQKADWENSALSPHLCEIIVISALRSAIAKFLFAVFLKQPGTSRYA